MKLFKSFISFLFVVIDEIAGKFGRRVSRRWLGSSAEEYQGGGWEVRPKSIKEVAGNFGQRDKRILVVLEGHSKQFGQV